MLKSGQVWRGAFATVDGAGQLSAATVGPVLTLYIDGVATADVVTVTGANPYRFEVTLPVLTPGQSVQLWAAATISGIARVLFVAGDMADTEYIGSRSALIQSDILSDSTPFAGASIAEILTDTGTTLPATLAAIQAKTNLLGALSVTVTSPVATNGDVETIRGCRYLNVDGNRLEWTVTTWNLSADSTLIIIIQGETSFTATYLSGTSLGLELTGAQTLLIPENKTHKFTILEYKSGATEPTPLLQGVWDSKKQPSAT